MNEYLTTQQLFEELQRRWEHDTDVSEQLASESNKLQERINKAIEYINSFEYYIPEDNKPELLEILKGE